MFSYLDYWRIWERYLGNFDGRHVYLQMTPINGWRQGSKSKVVAECLLVRSYPPQKAGPLPENIKNEMDEFLGEFAIRLREFDYMSEVSAEQISAAMERSNGGGVPFVFVKVHTADPTKYWQWPQ